MAHFPNYAGVRELHGSSIDELLIKELGKAGIPHVLLPEMLRGHHREVPDVVLGDMYGWTFRRAWRYWIAEGPGIPVEDAEKLHARFGQEVRVDGHGGCPSPAEWFKGFAVGHYHVDTEEGLTALANLIAEIHARCPKPTNPMDKRKE